MGTNKYESESTPKDPVKDPKKYGVLPLLIGRNSGGATREVNRNRRLELVEAFIRSRFRLRKAPAREPE